jgi:hypothetical protein
LLIAFEAEGVERGLVFEVHGLGFIVHRMATATPHAQVTVLIAYGEK